MSIDNNSPSFEGFAQWQRPPSRDNMSIEDKADTSPDTEIKSEQNGTESNNILGVFDQLDAQLFGKYIPLNYPSE
ncbi:Asparaginase [Saccharomyces pastorianus]|nr:Asparaginase [Saccharomyces pastorianus]